MKITKTQLKQLIKEELGRVLNENESMTQDEPGVLRIEGGSDFQDAIDGFEGVRYFIGGQPITPNMIEYDRISDAWDQMGFLKPEYFLYLRGKYRIDSVIDELQYPDQEKFSSAEEYIEAMRQKGKISRDSGEELANKLRMGG